MKRREAKSRRRSAIAVAVFALLALLTVAARAQDLSTLAETLRSGNTEQKRTALMQIRGLRSEEASRIAVAALKDGEPMVRATATASVTFLPKTEASAALAPLLRDKDEFVRGEAAYALGEVGDPSSASYLLDALRRDKGPEVRAAAAVALGKVGNPAAIPILVDLLNKRPTEDTELLRRADARSIGQIAQIMRSGKVRVVTPQNFLPEKYKDIGPKPSADFREHFVMAVDALIRVLNDPKETDDTRREAAFSLGAIGDQRAHGVLTKYLSSTDPYLAEICKEGLLKLNAAE
ncbi:MAG TPA: HEAT repeat domain-containing protein [Pyrinomonadaceae bacterium]